MSADQLAAIIAHAIPSTYKVEIRLSVINNRRYIGIESRTDESDCWMVQLDDIANIDAR